MRTPWLFPPFPWPEQCEPQTWCSGRLSAPFFRGNCWTGREGTSTPCDQSNTSGWGEVNSGAEVVHLPWNASSVTASQLLPALPFQALCRSRDEAWLPGVFHACAELPRWASTAFDPLSEFRVTQSNGRQVNIGFCERLVVSPGISKHQKSWLPEHCMYLVREGSRSEAADNGSGSSSSVKLQQSSLASVPGGYDTDTIWVFSGSNAQAANRIFSQALFRCMI